MDSCQEAFDPYMIYLLNELEMCNPNTTCITIDRYDTILFNSYNLNVLFIRHNKYNKHDIRIFKHVIKRVIRFNTQ